MKRAWAIAGREYASFFRTPLGWVVVALFLALSGLVFASRAVAPGEPASMRAFFSVWWALLVFIAPAVSMRLLSEELRTGTVEPLLTTPISALAVVTGKYAAAVLFLLTMLAPTLVYVGVLEWLSRPDYGPIGAGYLGIVLAGMLYLAVGVAASAMTSSQTLAFLGTLFFLLLGELLAVQAAGALPAGSRLAAVLYASSPNLRLMDFARGLIELRHIVFFMAASAFFLSVAVVFVEDRRRR